jgi:hypothetical protein
LIALNLLKQAYKLRIIFDYLLLVIQKKIDLVEGASPPYIESSYSKKQGGGLKKGSAFFMSEIFLFAA